MRSVVWQGCVAAARIGSAVLVVAVVSGCGADVKAGMEYQPAEGLMRLQETAVPVPHVGVVRDFELVGDTLYLLDRLDGVHVLQRAETGWNRIGQIGRAGAGPGEFRTASGITVTPSGALAVIEAGRLQVITPDGVVQSTTIPDLPCPMMLPGIAAFGSGFLVHGNCSRRGHVTDTVKAVLAWSPDAVRYDIVAEQVRFTRDGGLGSVFSAQHALTAGRDMYLFGTGQDDCLETIAVSARTAGGAPRTQRRCGLVQSLYSAPPPPELAGRLRSGTGGGLSIRWPDPLPVYIDRVRAGGTSVLLRPFTADSLVLQSVEPGGADLAVAPLDGFVSCKAAGCLWVLERSDPVELILLETATLEALLGGSGP